MWCSPLRGWRRSTPCPPCRYGAPIVLVVAYDKNSVFVFPGPLPNHTSRKPLAETVKYL